MPVYSRKNQYAGINAHLHSYFQAQGGWSSFHPNFIAALARDLNSRLPSGFIVDIEQSLQIREIHPDSEDLYYSLTAYSRRVDYESLPLRFERYSAADQARIQRRMETVQEGFRRGVDLDA